ncbi:MAG TPA: hypothetical protein VFI22_03500, partial [Thermomicrobiales bacterium]|nr:hypothetical protein [Thermomicrobiales bacterium]
AAVVEATEPPRRDRDRPSPTPVGRRSTVVPAIVPLRDGATRDVVVPGVPTFTVPAIEPAQGVPTIAAVDPKPRKTKTGRGRDDGPGAVFPNGAIDTHGGRTPGAKGAHRGIPGMFHPGRGAAASPGHDKNDHANGNGDNNGHDKNKDKDKGRDKKPGH